MTLTLFLSPNHHETQMVWRSRWWSPLWEILATVLRFMCLIPTFLFFLLFYFLFCPSMFLSILPLIFPLVLNPQSFMPIFLSLLSLLILPCTLSSYQRKRWTEGLKIPFFDQRIHESQPSYPAPHVSWLLPLLSQVPTNGLSRNQDLRPRCLADYPNPRIMPLHSLFDLIWLSPS